MSLKIDRLQLEIVINNDQARRSLIALDDEARNIQKSMKGMKEGTDEWIQATKRLSSIKTQMDSIQDAIGLTGLSLKELRNKQKEFNMIVSNLPANSPEYAKYKATLDQIKNRIGELTGKADAAKMSFGKLADGFNKYFAIVTAGLAVFSGFALSVKSMITAQGELDDSLADIRKTTGMTAAEVQNLNTQLGKIDTRTSRQDLRAMAVVAGQLGISTDQVYSFVDSVDKLNVALGDEISGGAEEVAKTMGTLRNVLTDMKSANISDDMLRLGNAVNVLGAAGFATAPVVSDFANRIGGIGIPLGLTSDEVLGLSATLQELNVSTERGGTAVTKILQKMTTNVGDFAKIAGMNVKPFTELVNRDLFGAFTKVLEGSKRGGQSATLLAGIIKELEISGAGASEVFAKVGNNIGMLNEKVSLAGKSLQNTDSIMNEFNLKNMTLGAVLDKLQKSFYNLITMPGVTEFFKLQVLHVFELVNWLKNLPQFIEKYRVTLIVLTGAIGVWIAAMTRSIQVSILNNLMMKEGILLKIKDAIALQFLIAQEQLSIIWKGNGTVATKLATTAQYLWNAAIKANPIGLLIMGITGLVAAIKAYDKYNSEAIRNDQIKTGAINRMNAVNKLLSAAYNDINGQIRILNKLSQQEKQDLEDKIEMNIKLAETELILMKARQQKVKEDNSKPTLWQRTVNFVANPGTPGIALMDNAVDAAKNGKEAADQLNDSIKSIQKDLDDLKQAKSQLIEITRAESLGDQILGKLKPQLDEKLNYYRTALKNYTSESEEYIRIQEKIKATNKELQKYNDDGADPASGPNKLKTAYEKLEDEIKKLDILLKSQLATHSKESQATAEKLIQKTAEKKALDDQYKALLGLNKIQDEGNALLNEYNEKLRKLIEVEGSFTEEQVKEKQINKASQAETALRIQQIKNYKAALDDLVKKLQEKAAAELGPIDKLTGSRGIDSTYLPKAPDKLSSVANDETQPGEMGFEGNGALGVDIWGPKAQAVMDYANTVLSALGSVDQAMSAYENAQLQKDENANNKKKDNLKKQLDSKKITQKQYDANIAKMDQEMDAKKKELSIKQAKRQKALSLVQAIISVAQAVTSALSAGPIIGIILAALVGILGAVQIGYIASTPIPEAARGRYGAIRKSRQAATGRYDVLGQDDNKQYRGVPFIDQPPSGVYGTPTLFAETGKEIILNPKHTENLMRFQPGLLDAIMQVPQRAGGLWPDAAAQRAAAGGPVLVQFHPDTLKAMEAFQEHIKNPITANIVYDNLKYSMDTVAQLEKSVTR